MCSVPSDEYHGRSVPLDLYSGLRNSPGLGITPLVNPHAVLTDVAGRGGGGLTRCSVPSFEYHGMSVPPDAYGGLWFLPDSDASLSSLDDVDCVSDDELDNSSKFDTRPRDVDACVNL